MNLFSFLAVTAGAWLWLGWRGAVVAVTAAFFEYVTTRSR